VTASHSAAHVADISLNLQLVLIGRVLIVLPLRPGFILILKYSTMKSDFYRSEREKLSEQDNLWQPFESHLDSLYFPGAAELLDTQTIAFEYDHFRNYFTRGR
jgi:hypothetical protein